MYIISSPQKNPDSLKVEDMALPLSFHPEHLLLPSPLLSFKTQLRYFCVNIQPSVAFLPAEVPWHSLCGCSVSGHKLNVSSSRTLHSALSVNRVCCDFLPLLRQRRTNLRSCWNMVVTCDTYCLWFLYTNPQVYALF